MRWIHLSLVWKARKLVMQGVVHHCGHHLRCIALAARQIRAPYITHEQRVAGEHLLRLIGNFGIYHQNRNPFRSVTGSFHEPEHNHSQANFVPILHSAMRKGRASLLSKYDYRAGTLGEFPMAAYKICMKMR